MVLALSNASPVPDAAERLVDYLEDALGERTYRALADEIGISEAMVRALLSGASGAGASTLGALMVWDAELEPVILEHLRERGRRFRGEDRPVRKRAA